MSKVTIFKELLSLSQEFKLNNLKLVSDIIEQLLNNVYFFFSTYILWKRDLQEPDRLSWQLKKCMIGSSSNGRHRGIHAL